MVDPRQALLEQRDGILQIIPARCQNAGGQGIVGMRAIGRPGFVFLRTDIALDDLNDAVEVGDQTPRLRGFAQDVRAPKLALVSHFLGSKRSNWHTEDENPSPPNNLRKKPASMAADAAILFEQATSVTKLK